MYVCMYVQYVYYLSICVCMYVCYVAVVSSKILQVCIYDNNNKYVCMYVSHQQDDLDIINLWDRLTEQAESFKTISDKNISIVFKTQNPGQVNLHTYYILWHIHNIHI